MTDEEQWNRADELGRDAGAVWSERTQKSSLLARVLTLLGWGGARRV